MPAQHKIYQDLEKNYREGKKYWAKDITGQAVSDRQIVSMLQYVPHKSILEVGCGTGTLTKELVKQADKVTAIDVSPSAIAAVKRSVPQAECIVSSLEAFHSPITYDVVICSEILYYIKDRQKAVKKIKELGKYLLTKHFLLGSGQIGFGSILYEILLSRYKIVKMVPDFTLQKLSLGIRTIRKLS